MSQLVTSLSKLSSEGQINFANSAVGSLVIHPEEERASYTQSTENVPEVDEDLVQDENPQFYRHLSLRFYGQDATGSQSYGEEVDHYSEDDNQQEYHQDQGENEGDSPDGVVKVKSFSDINAATRRKRSDVEGCYEVVDKLKGGNGTTKRSTNKSEDAVGIQGLLGKLNSEGKGIEGYFNKKDGNGQVSIGTYGINVGRRAKAVKQVA